MVDPSERQGPGAGALDTAVTADSRRGAIAVDANTLNAAPAGPRLADDDDGFPVRGWDRYEFIARIGAGGMGTVYYARDPRLGRDVALKFIRGNDLRLTLRLVREARAQARIDHPNVCKVYEAGEIAGKAYIAMELIDGRPLGECGDLSFHAKLETIRDVARALHEAHKLGILHRDIKPGNIMLAAPDDEGRTRPVVMDFGIAHDRENDEAMTQTGALLGTPAYMSPEQARSSRDLDRRSDVYSLGVTLFELLAGRPPFAADTPVQVILAVLHDEGAEPRHARPRGAGGRRHDRPEVPAQAPRRALRLGPRAGRGPRPLHPRRADPRPPRGLVATPAADRPASPRPGRHRLAGDDRRRRRRGVGPGSGRRGRRPGPARRRARPARLASRPRSPSYARVRSARPPASARRDRPPSTTPRPPR
jgi:serine/threonine protein kinase